MAEFIRLRYDSGVCIQGMAIFALLYADDIVLFGFNRVGMQQIIDLLGASASILKLSVNKKKTKVSWMKESQRHAFQLDGVTLEYISEWKHLGCMFSGELGFRVAP